MMAAPALQQRLRCCSALALQRLLLLLLALVSGAAAARDWRMLDSYPQQYVATALGGVEHIAIDGELDEPAWAAAPWLEGGIVDITSHQDDALNAVPRDLQMRTKLRWDRDYLYVGCELHEAFVTGVLTGHNQVPPYHDNDFEIFIDVSGTTEYYVEYEMSVLNSTYDIKWGKAVGSCTRGGIQSNGSYVQPDWKVFPTCVNTSFRGYAGSWSMASAAVPHNATYHPPVNPPAWPKLTGSTASTAAQLVGNTGMLSATSWDPEAFDSFVYPSSKWTAEIRFPIRQTAGYSIKPPSHADHGGLLDADPVRQAEYDSYDPSLGDAGPGRPRYWWIDFARAEHTRTYHMPDGSVRVCPKNCTRELETAINSTKHGGPDRAAVKSSWPTFLGGGYWEWVWGPVGDAEPGKGYMHRPSSWPLLQFAAHGQNPDDVVCGNIEFPARHVAKSVYMAQRQHALLHNGSFATSLSTLINASYCNLMLTTSDTCDILALEFAHAHPEIFAVRMVVTQNASTLTRRCTARPCYQASVELTVPRAGPGGVGEVDAVVAPYALVVGINENRYTWATHPQPTARAPCLPMKNDDESTI
jgi:hypothetical protein